MNVGDKYGQFLIDSLDRQIKQAGEQLKRNSAYMDATHTAYIKVCAAAMKATKTMVAEARLHQEAGRSADAKRVLACAEDLHNALQEANTVARTAGE